MMTSRPKSYPSWVFNVREDITRRNMREYDRQQAAIEKRCTELHPEYRSMSLRDRYNVWKEAAASLGY